MKEEVVILTDENFPYGSPGANYIRNLTSGLYLNSKYKIQIWLQSGNSRPDKEFANSRFGSINSIKYRYLSFFLQRPRSIYGKLLDDIIGIINSIFLLLRKRNKINVFIVYNNSTLKTIIPLVICKVFRITTLKILSEWYEKDSIVTSKVKYFQWWDFTFGMAKQNIYYDGLIVLSSFLKNYYISKGYSSNNLIVLPNLVNLEEFSAPKNNTNVSFDIGYSGNLGKKDGILDLLKAFGLLLKYNRSVKLLLIGDISQTKSTIPFLKKKAHEFGIQHSNIHFTGLVDYRSVPELLRSCAMLVLARPSGRFAEAGFPTKLGEYLACKKPVVLTRVGDIPKYFKDKVNAIIVEPNNPQSLYQGLQLLLDNPSLAKEIAQKGYEWAALNLEFRRATMKVVDFIESFH